MGRKKPAFNKLLLSTLLMLGFIMVFFYKLEDSDDTSKESTQVIVDKGDEKASQNREPASIKKGDKTSTVATNHASSSLPQIPSQNEPIISLLEKYEIDYKKDAVVVGDQTWFFSDKYSIVPKGLFKEGMGKVAGQDDFFVITELYGNRSVEKFPPLVVSYNTGSIVPITGDLFIKYENFSESYDFLRKTKNSKIIRSKSLTEISRMQLVPQRKDQVVAFFKKVKSFEGQHSIVHVDFIKNYIAKPI
jgi:hypothetical protein